MPESEENKIDIPEVTTQMDSTHNTKYIMGQFDPSSHPLFTLIESKYADREGLYMRKEAYESFKKMWKMAKTSGINLQIRSATRNFNYQRGIWERKWRGITTLSDGTKASDISEEKTRALKILLYSSMPGTSRHHWGTDIDLNSFDNSWFETGEGLELYSWMLENAHDFGFCQVYTQKGDHRPYGYEEEKWHWSYKPISKSLTEFAKDHLENKMLEGFEGADAAMAIDVVTKYVLGVDPGCL